MERPDGLPLLPKVAFGGEKSQGQKLKSKRKMASLMSPIEIGNLLLPAFPRHQHHPSVARALSVIIVIGHGLSAAVAFG